MSGIYISYRRMESAAYAGRLFDHLSRHFGQGSVFMDIGSIAGGQDFAQVIESALNACDVVLVLIGSTWASCTGQDGRRRLDDPEDWVRLEVAAALRRNVLVVPVLVEGVRIPDPASLPEELRPLCRRNARELSDLRWAYDVEVLVKDLEKVVHPKRWKVPDLKGKGLRWLTQGAIAFFLLLTVVLIGLPVLRKAPPVAPVEPKPAISPKPSEVIAKGKQINLLASENGGMLLAAAFDNKDWAVTFNGDENPTGKILNVPAWAVFAFKEQRSATFDVFTMLIAETSPFNVKEFELLKGNESPAGSFQSIGKFQTFNGKLFKTPYQEFKFFPVTAKYLKVTVLSSHSGVNIANVPRLQLFGVLQ